MRAVPTVTNLTSASCSNPRTDNGEVRVVVIADVHGLPPHELPVDEHREATLLQAGLSGQRLRVVQEAVAVVPDSDQHDVPAQVKKVPEGRAGADSEVPQLVSDDLLRL